MNQNLCQLEKVVEERELKKQLLKEAFCKLLSKYFSPEHHAFIIPYPDAKAPLIKFGIFK